MEVRDFALGILTARSLEGKLPRIPRGLTDRRPGPPLHLEGPVRPPALRMVSLRETRVPRREGLADPAQRPRILHALANHELQAAELFAWALLAFPEAEPEFRRGLLRQVGEEARHTRMYLARLRELGTELGDHPVSGYFWSKAAGFTTPLRFICAMALTFENANLDHTLDYASTAREAGDPRTASLLERIHEDEVEHVRFGWEWLGRWKEEGETMAEAYSRSVTWPLRAALARGKTFHRGVRERAGLDPEFLRLLEEASRESPPGARAAPAGRG